MEFEEDTRTMRWNGRFSACTFEGLVPESFAGKQVRIRGRVRQGLTVLTDLRLILKVEGTPTTAPAPEETQTVPLELCALRSAFLSYASQDRARVAACIRGILLVRPDLDIFFDVVSLRRGEHYEERIFREIDRRDLFYLFWSVAASRSEWVGRELSFALDHLGKERVEPVPLDPPDRCPPPAALNDRHFNDWLLRYESSSNSQPLATPTFFWLQTESGVSVFVPAEGGCLGRKGLGRELFAGDRNVELWHAQAVLLDGRVHIQDLESTSGVLLNGTRLSPYRLTPVEPGDQLTLGSTTFTLRTL